MIPIRWRLTIFHSVMTLLIAAGLVIGVFIVLIWAVESEVGDRAEIRAEEAAQIVQTRGTLDEADLERLSGNGVEIIVRDAQGIPVLEPQNELPERIDDRPVWEKALELGGPFGETVSVRSTLFPPPNPEFRTYERVFVHAIPVEPVGSPIRVVEARIPYDSIGSSLLPVVPLAGLAVVGSLLSIGGSYILTRKAFAPVNAVVQSTREITESNLSQRLPVKSRRDEISRLAMTFNDLLSRLEVAFREREEVLESQRRFVADASHELRTPLTSILGYSRLLKQWGLEDPDAARESVASIEQQAAHMYRLVENLLSLARGDEAGALDLQPHDLRAVVSRAMETGLATAGGRVVLRDDSDETAVMALIDPDALYQAATILIDNAIKYTPPGGSVTVAARNDRRGPQLVVADTGIGIPSEHLPHLFERFYRVDQARSQGGTGLGLAIAQQIVALHGGTIEVESASGQGSTFTICLPQPPAHRTSRLVS